MLTAVFGGHGQFVALAVVLSCAVGAVTCAVARRKRARPLAWGLWGACTTATLALTLWSTGDGGEAASCTVNLDVFEPFRQTQGLLNFGMLVPFGLLGVLATGRPVLVAALGLLLPAAIETAQALAPIGRACDTSDLVANGLGALLGTAAGTVLAQFGRGTPLSPGVTRRAFLGGGVAAAVMGALLFSFTEFSVVSRTVNTVAATAEQKAAIDGRLRAAFGGAYRATDHSVTLGEDGTGTVTAFFGAGAAELSWPDQSEFTASMPPADVEPGQAFAVPGTQPRPATGPDAVRIAEAYAGRYAPGWLKNAKIHVSRDDGPAGRGWHVYWRRREGKVLLPPGLDLRMDGEGRISDLTERRTNDPARAAAG
ncbi:VanZ family protein [Streptomyces monomycini]|uniref:VanZ family protein n=1 Tax=Streptomyces monomycini TaxID=371720 RepID=UPI0004AA0AD5|nr:VanZ family protein [Streptomyces monomycini]